MPVFAVGIERTVVPHPLESGMGTSPHPRDPIDPL